MAELAVAEVPVTEPESQTQTTLVTQDAAANPAVTGEQVAAQTGELPVVDEGEKLRLDAIEAARLEGIEEGRLQAEAQKAETTREAARKQRLEDLGTTFTTEARTIRQNLAGLIVQDSAGNMRGLTDAEINSLVLSSVERLHGKHLGVKETELNTPFELGTEEVLTKDAFKAFAAKADGKAPKEFVKEFGEAYAPQSHYVRTMTAEDAEKVSPKLKKDIAAIRSHEFDKGRAQGHLDPPGDYTGSSGGTPAANLTYDQFIRPKPGAPKLEPAKALELLEAAAKAAPRH